MNNSEPKPFRSIADVAAEKRELRNARKAARAKTAADAAHAAAMNDDTRFDRAVEILAFLAAEAQDRVTEGRNEGADNMGAREADAMAYERALAFVLATDAAAVPGGPTFRAALRGDMDIRARELIRERVQVERIKPRFPEDDEQGEGAV